MAIELHIAGPGLDGRQRLEAGAAPLVLGRDAECDICLPDPERNVSRRHLSVWNEGDALHFHVLSVVNGVDMPFGEAPPGARGVLPAGQELKLAAYTLRAEPVPASEAGTGEADPWSVFDRDSSGIAPVPPGLRAPAPGHGTNEPDPFGDWGFETTFGADMPGAGGLQARSLAVAADLQPFLRGLGVDPAQVGALSEGELESIGRFVRSALLGLRALQSRTAADKRELRAEDRTMLAAAHQENNPFKTADWPDEIFLRYLFGGRAASVGFMGPERAVREVVGDLVAHEAATAAAARAAVEGVLREFDPDALKSRLLGGGAKLFESARAWEAYSRDYATQREAWDTWVQRLLDKYFAEAYVRESVRVKRDTPPRGG
jgi:predicted component of type VI protein secretion system